MNKTSKDLENKIIISNWLKGNHGMTGGCTLYQDDINDYIIYMQAGMIGKINPCNQDISWYGAKDGKRNGYKYIPIILDDHKIEIGIHTIIGMLAYPGYFEAGLDRNIVLCINHKDNIPWHNTPDNLEWTDRVSNAVHGKFISSIVDCKIAGWIEHNKKDKDFKTLGYGISVAWVKRFLSIRNIKIKKNMEIDRALALDFYTWYKKESDCLDMYIIKSGEVMMAPKKNKIRPTL